MKPILFNTKMTEAILEGRKTVTRRVIKPKYSNTHIDWKKDKYGTRLIEIQNDIEGETHGRRDDGTTWHKLLAYTEISPPYRAGDILYVRETWRPTIGKMHTIDLSTKKIIKTTEHKGYEYKAHIAGKGEPHYFPDGFKESEDWEHLSEITYSGRWHPSIHMPREASRIFLQVTGVRAEKLQDMTIDGALHEGADISQGFKDFKSIWDSTIPKESLDQYGWDANPWVWAVEFERTEKPKEK